MRQLAGVRFTVALLFALAPFVAHADLSQSARDTLTTDPAQANGGWSEELGSGISGALTKISLPIRFTRSVYGPSFSFDLNFSCNTPEPHGGSIGGAPFTTTPDWHLLAPDVETDVILTFDVAANNAIPFDPSCDYSLIVRNFAVNAGGLFRVYGSATDTYPYGSTDAGGLSDLAFTLSGVSNQPVAMPAPSVLFLPGLEGSKLYQEVEGVEAQRWPPRPSISQADVKALYLDASGNSLNTIYTKSDGMLSSIDYPPFYHLDIYTSFLSTLDQMKSSGEISDWSAFPYDWRKSPEDIANNGTLYNDGVHSLEAEVERLAQNGSKVILVGHSNGGLVAKALMRKLEADGKTNLVSKVILLASPQLGTPMAIGAMLHGDFSAFPGLLISQSNFRGIGENMPDAYALLPSSTYFSKVLQPVVTISATSTVLSKPGFWPTSISTFDTLSHFLTEASGRTKPSFGDTNTANVLSSSLLAQATSLHANLDTWAPPAGVDAMQIVGWGVVTPAGENYRDEQKTSCGLICSTTTRTVRDPIVTEDGDGTVVSPSAAANPGWPTYFLNINQYNFDLKKNSSHALLTEMPAFQSLFLTLLASSSPFQLHTYVTTAFPSSTEQRLRLAVHSPVSIDVYDSHGNHTGLTPGGVIGDLAFADEQIPNSYYWQMGEDKYIGVPGDEPITVTLHGLDTGTFTFEVQKMNGDTPQDSTTYANLPVTASTTATLSIDAFGAVSPFSLDINGDGQPEGVITSPTTNQNPLTYAKLIRATETAMDLGPVVKLQLIARNVALELLIKTWQSIDTSPQNTKKKALAKQAAIALIDDTKSYVQQTLKKGAVNSTRITSSQAAALLDMMSVLKALIK